MADQREVGVEGRELPLRNDVDGHRGTGNDARRLADPPDERDLAEVAAGTDLVDRLTVAPDLRGSVQHDDELAHPRTLAYEHGPAPRAESSRGA